MKVKKMEEVKKNGKVKKKGSTVDVLPVLLPGLSNICEVPNFATF